MTPNQKRALKARIARVASEATYHELVKTATAEVSFDVRYHSPEFGFAVIIREDGVGGTQMLNVQVREVR